LDAPVTPDPVEAFNVQKIDVPDASFGSANEPTDGLHSPNTPSP
jgi:hypothetical protein